MSSSIATPGSGCTCCTESWASDPEKDGRATAFRNYRAINIDKAGHWVHHDELGAFLKVVTAFL